MSVRKLVSIYEFIWMLQSHHQQRLAWSDAAAARTARDRAEALAAAQLEAMLIANPSGQLGHSKLNDIDTLEQSGLL